MAINIFIVCICPFSFLSAAPEQEDKEQNRKWDSDQPKQDVARRACYLRFVP